MIKKFLFRIFLILLALMLLSALFLYLGPTGSLIVKPLLAQWGKNEIPSLHLENASGNLRTGIILEGISLVSEDRSLLRASRVLLKPAWSDIFSGRIRLAALEVEGLSTDVADLKSLASRYGRQERSSSDGMGPIRLLLKDITIETPLHSIKLDEGILSRSGELAASVDMGGLPLHLQGLLSFEPFSAQYLNLQLGSGRASLRGSLSAPFDIEGDLTSLDVGELLSVVSPLEGNGAISGRFKIKGEESNLRGWGVIHLESGDIMNIPLSANIPWNYKNGILTATQMKVESLSADITLKASADLRPTPETDRIFVRGSLSRLSMQELERALSLNMNLDGNEGMVDFWVSADQFGNKAGKAFLRLPRLSASGNLIAQDLRTSIFFEPGKLPRLESSGSLFGSRLRGEGRMLGSNPLRPALFFSAEGLNSRLLSNTFPALRALNLNGVLNLSIIVDENLSLIGEMNSPRLNLAGSVLTNLLASVRFSEGRLILEDFRGRLGRSAFNIAGNADIRTQGLNFNGTLVGLEPRSVPALSGYVEGTSDISLAVRGTIRSPQITLNVSGSENRLAGIPVKRLRFSGTYSDRRITLPETLLLIPGGSLAFRGNIDLPQGREPLLNLSGNLSNLNLGTTINKKTSTDITGRLEGSFSVSGPLRSAALAATLKSDKIKVASTDVRSLIVEFSGTTQKVTVRNLSAQINNGSISGKGYFGFTRQDKIKIDMQVKDINIRSLLEGLGIEGFIGGQLNGALSLQGSPVRPELSLKVYSPMTIKETLIDRLAVTVLSPAKGYFDINASGVLGDLKLTVKGALKQEKEGWSYAFKTDSMDVSKLVAAKMPSARDTLSGSVEIQAKGKFSRQNKIQPLNVTVKFPSLSAAGATFKNLLLPIRINAQNAAIQKGTGSLFGGQVLISADIALNERRWRGNVRVSSMDIGKAASVFLKEGAIVGSADLNIDVRGNFGALMMVFANGSFNSGEGYIHKFKALERVAKNGRVSFRDIRGSFFWDGRDLWLNPGTQVRSLPNEPLYRYFAANGPLGIPGKGLALNCQGRFDVRALDTVLSAMKSAFQLMTGSLTGGTQLVRQTVSKIIGYNQRDFQEVSFQLRGSWKELQLLNLRIDKSLEGFLPRELPTGRKDEERKIQFNLRIPVGPGGGNSDGASTEDQLKKQFLDNLLNQLQY